MNIQMPRMGGIDATRLIRQLSQGQHVSIVPLSANVFAEDRRRCLSTDMNDFVSKPIVPADLFATIMKWLTHGHTAGER